MQHIHHAPNKQGMLDMNCVASEWHDRLHLTEITLVYVVSMFDVCK